jgi:hypothetical protein
MKGARPIGKGDAGKTPGRDMRQLTREMEKSNTVSVVAIRH